MTEIAAPWLLLKACTERPDSLRRGAGTFSRATGVRLHRIAWSADTGTAYLYARPMDPATAPTEPTLATLLASHFPDLHGARVAPLAPMFDIAGASAGQRPRFHYVVETDPEQGWADEIARWYDTEHMPGLAAVPGCVRAMRFLSPGLGPLSLACYDLTQRETLGSPPWLAVRATPWSDRARPHFTNTRRTMFEVIDAD